VKYLILFFLINGFLTEGVVHTQSNFTEKGPDYQKRFEKIKLSHYQKERMGDQYGTKFMLDTTKYITPLPEEQTHPDIAFDGTNYFVVWQDWDGYNELRGTRVDTAGNVIDYGGIWLSDGGYHVSTVPGVSFGDSIFLVAFEDVRYTDFDLFGVRIKPDGTVLDPNGFTIISEQYNQGSARVSFDGTNFLIVFSDFNYDTWDETVWGVRVSPDGTVLDPGGFPIQAYSYDAKMPEVAFDGTNYLAIWKDYRSGDLSYVYGARIGTDGVVIDPAGFPISAWETGWGWPSVTFGGSNYFVTWRDTTFNVVGARVTPDGQVIDVPPINISPVTLQYTEAPRVTFDGQNYFVFWSDGYTKIFYLTRVDLDGNVLDPTPIQVANITSQGLYRNVCSGITNSFVVWAHLDDIYGARIDTSGNVLDPDGFPVSVSNNYQEFPALSYDNQNYFSVWSEFRDGLWDIYGIRCDTMGNRIEANAFPIAQRDWTQYWGRIAYLDTINLVVWHASPATWDVHGARVTRSGNVLDPLGLAIGAWQEDQAYPSVAAGDSTFFVVWDDSRNGDEDIYGAMVNKAGQNLNPLGLPISTASYAQWYPSVAFDGTNYCVIWEDFRSMNANWGYIYGSRVDQGGTVLDEFIVNGNVSAFPRIAFGENQFLAIWMDIRTYNNYDIYASRIKPDGMVLDPDGFPICTNSADQAFPDVIYDGARYVVVWEDYRNGNADIYGAIVDTNGTVDSTFILTQESGTEYYVAAAKGPSDQIFYNYTGWDDGYRATRIFGYLHPETGVEEIVSTNPRHPGISISPNPFNDRVEISLVGRGHGVERIELQIFDVAGRRVRDLILHPCAERSRGASSFILRTEATWDGRDMYGKKVSPGAYFLKCKIGNREQVYKLIKMSK
jgi:hypothetical protein